MNRSKGVGKVLITGSSGYLGSFVIQRLRSKFELTLFDRILPRADHADLTFIRGDITDAEAVRQACSGHDAVVHMVSLVRDRWDKPASLFADVTVKGTWHVAQGCVDQGVQRLVNISSVSVIWPDLKHGALTSPKEDVLRFPIPADAPIEYVRSDLYYRLSKALAEQVCDAYHAAYDLAVIHLRPGVIVGDGANGQPKPEDGKWSAGKFFHVDPRDVAQAVESALTTEVTHGCYSIVAGRCDSLFEWESAAREIGYEPQHNWPEIQELQAGG